MRKITGAIKMLMVVLALMLMNISTAQNNDFEIAKNLDILATLFKELNINYADDINPGKLTEAAIDAMLESLDPYTNFIPEADIEDYRFITTGQYGGIGALIHKRGDYIIISEPYKNFPADKAGLKAGDIILEVNDKSTKDKSTSEVSQVLKGQPGTAVKLLIKRDDTDEQFTTTVNREQIKIPDIPYYGMLEEGVGYIKLTGFTQDVGRDVRKAFIDLKENNDMTGIILDLRGNGGGLLQEAVNIVNIFVDKDQLVVNTKGKLKDRNRSYKTMMTPVDNEIPVAVLVDNSSASASEIVAGAMQDLDRGVIIGQRTFGKGLVQNVIPLSYNTQMKVTVAKYYIPSGRCIQAIDYFHKDNNGQSGKIPDSLITAFNTKKGRIVYDGIGLEPDLNVDPLQFSYVSYTLLNKNLIFDYATKYYWAHPTITSVDKFEIDDTIYNDFLTFLQDKDYNFTSRTENKLKELKDIAGKEDFFESIKQEIELLSDKIEESKKDDLHEYADEIRLMLKLEMVTRYYYSEGRIIASLASDPDITKAIEVLNDPLTYSSILDGTYAKKDTNKSTDQ